MARTSNTNIIVDHNIPSDCSKIPFFKSFLYPELAALGPSVFDPGSLELWIHHDQKEQEDGLIANIVREHLENDELIERCLSLRDLEEIYKRKPWFIRKNFKGNCILGWRSSYWNTFKEICVPCIIKEKDSIYLDFIDWETRFLSRDFTHLFPENAR